MKLRQDITSVRVMIERYPGETVANAHVFSVDREEQAQWHDSFEVGPFDTISDVVAQCIRTLQRHGVVSV